MASPRTALGPPAARADPTGRTGEGGSAAPLVIAHRGASGYRPEHTRTAYELAVAMGADHIEPDLVMTRDGVLVDRHEPDISQTTDVARRREFADRETVRVVDGSAVTGWFVDDFTLAELKTLRARERLADLRPESAAHDADLEVLTFAEVLRLRAELSRTSGRPVGVMPEIKNPTYLRERGFDPEGELVRVLREHDLDTPGAPVWVQSFEPTALRALRATGYRGRSVLLTMAHGAPFDLRGQGRAYADLTTAAAMHEMAAWVDGIAPAKTQVIPWTADGRLGEPTSLVADAHAVGLQVMPWSFRAENVFLPTDHRRGSDPATHGRLAEEIRAHLAAGVDGLFCDHPDVAVEARDRFLAGRR